MTHTTVRVSRNGQISLPATLRRRWGAQSMVVTDLGGYAVVRPMPDDPIAELLGSHRGSGPSSEQLRAAERSAPDRSTAAPKA